MEDDDALNAMDAPAPIEAASANSHRASDGITRQPTLRCWPSLCA